MATSMSAHLDIPADLDGAFALLSDPAYITEVATRTGGTDVDVSVTPDGQGGVTIVSARTLPAELPSYAKALVGDTVRLTETRTLGPVTAEGTREGRLDVEFGGAPATVRGTMRLSCTGATSDLDVDLQVKASVPLVGGKIEKVVVEQIQRALGKENQVAGEHAS